MKKMLITGAGRGIGLAAARQFAAAGWCVLSLDKEFRSDIVGERVAFDLTCTSQIAALIASIGDLRYPGQ
jgi:NAD(P)-dependent dehydrogenase (short-subunit alcohol dehydrogenase family)